MKLKQIEIAFLIENIPDGEVKRKLKKFSGIPDLTFSDNEKEFVLNILENLLTSKGLDEAGEVNKLGEFIDDLIGKFAA